MDPKYVFRGRAFSNPVTRHPTIEGEPSAHLPPRRIDDTKYHSQLLSHDLGPAVSNVMKITSRVAHTQSSGGSDSAPIQVLHQIVSTKQQARPIESTALPIISQPLQQPIVETSIAIRQTKELSDSRKSHSSSSAREFKDKIKEQLDFQPVKTRVVSDPEQRRKLQSVPGFQTTPPTAQKFWKDTLKQSRIQIHYNAQSPEQIAPVFRYCFVCQNSILQYNIAHHEKVCPRFDEMYNKTSTEIAKMLDQKVTRIKQEMRLKIQQRDRQGVSPLEPALTSVKDFLRECDKVEQRGNHQLHYQYENQFIRVEDCWSDMKLLELAHRLRWFMRIREQLRSRFQL